MASDPEDIPMQPPLEPLPASFDHGSSTSIPSPNMMSFTSAAIVSQRRRRKHPASLKRSASTPNVRELDDPGMTLAEKRRNKLGYHRTSVACGHCRRRKIRCLLAPEDAQNRCANCIRLKKECNFFPVDQQPQLDRRPRAGSKADTGGSTSSDSSPALSGGHLPYLLDHAEDFTAFSQPPLSAAFSPSRGSIGGLISPLTRVPINTHTFELPQQSRTTWDLPFADNGLTSADHSSPGDASHHYWGRHSDSPLTPGFSPHLAAPTGSVHSASDARSSFTSFAPSKSDSGWPVPSRSMSFGLVEDISHFGYPNPYHPQHLSMDLRRRASDMHPPSSQSSANSSNTSISEAHMTPLLGPLSSSPSLNWGVATSWAALPSSSLVTKAPDYWYSEPAPLAKVQEEDIGPHSSGEPTILYSDREHR